VLVVEGYMDVVALAQFDVGYAVATLGTATTPVHVQKLLRLTDELVFSFDGDAAGRKAAWRALEVSLPLALDHKPIRFLFLPQEDDPDTYIRRHGKDSFEKLVREAPTLSEFLLAELRAQADLGSAEGRSRFLAAARPHVQKVEAPALKLQLLKETAKLGGVTQEEAESLFEMRRTPAYRRPAPERRSFAAPSSNEWKLLARAAAKPAIAAKVDPSALDQDLPESQALIALASWSRESPDASDAMMLEHFRDSPHAELLALAQTYGEDLRETEEQALEFLRHTLWKLEIQRKDKEIQSLGDRLRKGQLSKEEHLKYAEMISEVKALEMRLQAEGRSVR
jgi:DNA primase